MNAQTFYAQLAHTPTQYLTTINGKRLWVKRDDLNDAVIQGNKLRKLKEILLVAEKERRGILSFGGAYSNHIDALAEAGRRFNIPTCAIIRGQELTDPARQSHTIKNALANGMRLHFVTREEYRQKESGQTAQMISQEFIEKNVSKSAPTWWCIPEGGSHKLSLCGASEIIDELDQEVKENDLLQKPERAKNHLASIPDAFFCACGTGGTLAGILQGAERNGWQNTKFIGVPVLKGAEFLYDDIRALNPNADLLDWSLNLDGHQGGYAKKSSDLLNFITYFEREFNVPIEPVYTAKLCKTVFELAKQSNEPADWLIYHSGGLQGREQS